MAKQIMNIKDFVSANPTENDDMCLTCKGLCTTINNKTQYLHECISSLCCGHITDFEACDIRQSTAYPSSARIAYLCLREIMWIWPHQVCLAIYCLIYRFQGKCLIIAHIQKIGLYSIIKAWTVDTFLCLQKICGCSIFVRGSLWWAELILVHCNDQNTGSQTSVDRGMRCLCFIFINMIVLL